MKPAACLRAPTVCSARFSNCGTPDPSMIDEEIGIPAKRKLSMRQLRHLLQLDHDGVSARESRATSWRGAFDDPGQSEIPDKGRRRVGAAAGRRRYQTKTILWEEYREAHPEVAAAAASAICFVDSNGG